MPIPQDMPRFGFGCMRLPLTDPADQKSFDYPKIEELFDAFLDAGFTYFDTAYTYHSYHAEEAVRKALVERHPRGSFQLATKMPLRDFQDAADMARIFDEQLENCGVRQFDFYLLHNMGANVYPKCCEYGAFDFVARKKREGYARFVGMSFHDSPGLLDEILTAYGDRLDFVQLQVNYVDQDSSDIQSRRCLEVARAHGKPVIVMEPCKGGTLTDLPEAARQVLADKDPTASPASWALRFAASQEGVFMTLSGMNALEQVHDNTKTFTPFKPLDEEETARVFEVAQIINAQTAVACTACGYCTHDCPQDIAIPQYFALYNNMMRTTGSFSSQTVYYNNIARSHGKASDCIGCGQCEEACPQHLPIPEYLKDVAEKFENNSIIPTRD
jgi:uncharacterized protein